jgi:hypothetical protein
MTTSRIIKTIELTAAQVAEIKECHPDDLCECYCDDGHEREGTVCMFCWYAQGRS